MSREIRKNILDPLNSCMAKYQIFPRRIDGYNPWETVGKPRLEGNYQTPK
jgi:hypothetical protein